MFGFAWSGFGSIASVEFSHDGGQTWQAAELQPPPSALAWTRWQATWTPTTPGRAQLVVRARDKADNIQPTSVPHNHYGYEMNAVETVDVEVQPGRTTCIRGGARELLLARVNRDDAGRVPLDRGAVGWPDRLERCLCGLRAKGKAKHDTRPLR